MHVRLEIVAVGDDGIEQRQEVADLQRGEATIETVGLTLEESKQPLAALQRTIVAWQVVGYLDDQRPCPYCGRRRQLKEAGNAPFRTLFGLVSLPNPRWQQCACQPQQEQTVRPLATLLPERSSPELRYLETKWAALASYGSATTMLHDVLPIDQQHSAVTVRNHLLAAARRTEQRLGPEQAMFLEGCPAERAQLPIPDGPLSVGLDGGIVRARRDPTGKRCRTASRSSPARVSWPFTATIPQRYRRRASVSPWSRVWTPSPSAASLSYCTPKGCRPTSS